MISKRIMSLTRCTLLVSLMLLALAAMSVGPLAPSTGAAELVILGVAGGPPFQGAPGKINHDSTGFMLVVNGEQYLVDCAGGTPNNILRAGYQYGPIHNVFFTHLHLDHYLGFAELIGRGPWTNPNPLTSLTAYGPQNTKLMNDMAIKFYMVGAELHTVKPIKPEAKEFILPPSGIIEIYSDKNVVVKAARVFHDNIDAYAYRFDIVSGKDKDKSIVFSGDRGPGPKGSNSTDQLKALAKDATVLLHEAQDNAIIPEFLKSVPPGQKDLIEKALSEGHTDVRILPQLAKELNIGTLVLQHYVPAGVPPALFLKITEEAAKACDYKGKVVAPTELNVIEF